MIMYYVYILQSIPAPDHFYVGYTIDLEKRLIEHISGKSVHTNKFKPWKYRTLFSFNNQRRAEEFEKYLKTSSGRAFTKKHF